MERAHNTTRLLTSLLSDRGNEQQRAKPMEKIQKSLQACDMRYRYYRHEFLVMITQVCYCFLLILLFDIVLLKKTCPALNRKIQNMV